MNKIVCISGGFDPIHIGHIRMIKEAAIYGTLCVILNNDNWLKKKKGYVFMNEEERKEILEAIKGVSGVFVSFHEPDCEDMTVCRELNLINPHIFANGGDRHEKSTPEKELCEKLGIKMVYNVGGSKIQSSSKLIKQAYHEEFYHEERKELD
jgi:D-beta-D-heptose 7-phosphate kinase/D-beta-D-heptose 1-phosphate adenosyltransferase